MARGRPTGSHAIARAEVYFWFRDELIKIREASINEQLSEKRRVVNHEAAMAEVERIYANAERIRKTIARERRTPDQQRLVDEYARAREGAGDEIFPNRPWSRLYHITPKRTDQQTAALVATAAKHFGMSQRTAQRRWDEFKKLPIDWQIDAFAELLATRRSVNR